MLRRLSRISLVLCLMLAGEVWALGLGEIKLESALNEPLRAEIELLSATPDELAGLKVALASAETFARYGLDRAVYLQNIQFRVVESGRADGNVVEIRSLDPITEPFLTFLVEASWSRGRLLREYTLLLDPPIFAPAAAQAAPAVQAPTRVEPADSARIERPAPAPTRQDPPPVRTSPPQVSTPPESAPAPTPAPAPVDNRPFTTAAGGDVFVQSGETLWGITSRVRPDSRLTMNQTMLAIFEANPEAFGGNINVLKRGASLRIPSADDIVRISRGEALNEVQRQHAAWNPSYSPAPTTTPSTSPAPIDDPVDYSYPDPDPIEDTTTDAVADTTADPYDSDAYDTGIDDTGSQPDLVLVPPDAEDLDGTGDGSAYGDGAGYDDELLSREEQIERRISEIESADVPVQQSLIEIRNNELAELRAELAEIRGETIDDPFADDLDDIMVDDSDSPFPDDSELSDEDEAEAEADPRPAPSPRAEEPGIVDQILDVLGQWWMWIAGIVVLLAGILFWFMRRGSGDDDPDWRSIDSDDFSSDLDGGGTEQLRAPSPEDESFVVVEQDSAITALDETAEALAPDFAASGDATAEVEALPADGDATGQFGSLEDTFSSETAINLDQTDPLAEADFHMAYGLYDQAADLVNGALEVEPERSDLLSKLCEIYFVWGNRDAFVDAATRLKGVAGEGDADWDKIVIMGQQIAADDALFSGAGVAGATKEVDLSFEADTGGTGALDMELGDDSGAADDVVDLGADLGGSDESSIDFPFADEASAEEVDPDPTATVEAEATDFNVTAEMPAVDGTIESPTIEQQFDMGTAELPSLDDDDIGAAIESSGQSSDATAEINLDELGLDLDGLDETEVASLDDETGQMPALEDTGINEAIDDMSVTGTNQALDADATGVNETLNVTDTGTAIDESLLDATGVTQVLSDDLAVATTGDANADLDDNDATMLAPSSMPDGATIGDDQETMLASLDDDDDPADFDFAKTEALPPDAFTGNSSLEETGEMPAVASTDVDLDLDDLTAALQVSEMGDTIEQLRDDATIEQPRPNVSGAVDENAETMALQPGDMNTELHDARTMTEVGTKLDLARAYVDMGDPSGARSILEEVLAEGDDSQKQQAQQLLDSLPS
ncbi:MAG: FimV/HubP family polar landmark protein [Pseudomonadota bacterium]